MSLTSLAISHIPAGNPPWMTPAVATGVLLHIGGGTIGIISGYGAVMASKGERLHRVFGTVFLGSMTVMAVMALSLATVLHQKENFTGGILALYLVTTAWAAVRRGDGQIGVFEYVAMAVAAGASLLLLSWGLEARAHPSRDEPATLFFAFSFLAALAAGLDLKTVLRGGVSGVQRIARHLWRMTFALFFAAGSFFLGQQKVMPKFMHGSPILLALGFAPLAFMVFWLIRVQFWNMRKSAAVTA